MAVNIEGLGLEWALNDTGYCISELTAMSGHPPAGADDTGEAGQGAMLAGARPPAPDNPAAPQSKITAGPAQDVDLPNASVDAIVFDPPYHNNVNYAELSDFFYVWLKRTVGYIYPELCRPYLADKVNEAIASPARFREQAAGQGQSAGKLATADYEAKMGEIFRECRRVIKPDGIMTVMFTHRTTAAWDALVTGLIGAGVSHYAHLAGENGGGGSAEYQGQGGGAHHDSAGVPSPGGEPDAGGVAGCGGADCAGGAGGTRRRWTPMA